MTLTSTSSLEETLNAYIADEYFASLQYRMAKVVAKGKALEYSNNVFGDNGDEEDEHFDEIVEYAQSLNIPVQVNPKEMETNCTTPFVDMHDGDTTAQLVAILIAAEKKAIEGYEIGLRNEAIINEHPELTQFLGEKLNDERGHLKELEDLESNIEASGKTVPQSDIGDEDEKANDDSDSDESDDAEENKDGSEDDSEEQKNESVENGELGVDEKPTSENEVIRKIRLGELDASEVVKNFISFVTEDRISDFVDFKNVFNSDLARDTSQYEENQCKNKLMEMIDDGIYEAEDILKRLIDFIGKEEFDEFAKDMGYSTKKSNESEESTCVHRTSMCESGMSFSDIFRSAIVNG